MLIELRVKDFGIIEEINWELEPGLNVITGETGAGKSLVIDAVEALLAGRTDADVIRHGANEAHVEGIVSLPRDEGMHRVREILCDNGLDSDDEILVINCEFRRQGRGIFRVNRKATPKSILQQIGRFLIDIHGQSQNLSLLDN